MSFVAEYSRLLRQANLATDTLPRARLPDSVAAEVLAILSDDIKTAFGKTKGGRLTARDAFNLDGLKSHLQRFAQDNKLHRFDLQP